MRNYITLNGKNSNEINGLLIQELPPISKPQIRTEVEEIDGRDGDIVTKLGFAAYDKEFTVGLYKDFDINAIIAYFNSEGTVVFSNEPDKYYNYQIIDQIDFERLVRYRTATVRMHCQPFKYSNTEGARTLGNKGTASGEGSFITLDNTPEAQFSKIDPKGNATQTTYSGKNLANYLDVVKATNDTTLTFVDNGFRQITTSSGLGSKLQITGLTPSTTYAVSWNLAVASGTANKVVRVFEGTSQSVIYATYNPVPTGATHLIFTTGASATSVNIWFYNGIPSAGDTTWTNIMLEKGNTATAYEPYVGGTSAPNPSFPQPTSVVTGENVVKIEGKNLFDYASASDTANTIVSSYRIFEIDGLKPGVRYTMSNMSFTAPISGVYIYFWGIPRYPGTPGAVITDGGQYNNSKRYDANSEGKIYLAIYPSDETTWNNSIKYFENAMLVEGTETPAYEPYHGQSYPISLGENYLARIPNTDYEDKPVKVDGTWYIRRMVGKVVLDGTENWLARGTQYTGYLGVYTTSKQFGMTSNFLDPSYFMCDHFKSGDGTYNATYGQNISSTQYAIYATIDSSITADATAFKTWLASNPTTVYYALAEPVDEEITNETLISQLEALYNQAHAYKDRTHVTAIAQSGNAPHIIEAEVQRSSDGNITNNGNIASKPTLTIYGSGNIGVSLNGYQVFEITLGDEEYITIDTAAMEAYKDTLDNLKNRLVNGDYSKFALRPGSNMIEFSGTVSKCVISKYSRWL